jgi:hypothetical protein
MPIINLSPLLRRSLVTDAVVSGAAGLLMTLGTEPLTRLLGYRRASCASLI